ncbi:DUF2242 domain-containing protein [Paraburkholderia tropica]|uniref:DUF2242 domain-containing protein n=1 Tax=Paraburkholderia tropica TaxID=92647 RepID=UPI002AB61046|nr:DUF2242 domain-containing protein [Paraburkholderia tropica]
MSRFSRVAPFLLIPLAAALGACSSAKPKFQDDQLWSSAPSPFSRNFAYSSADACEASRRALLSQGYMTTMAKSDTVDATKNFQPTSDQHIVVEVHVVCTSGDASNSSMVYVNAVQNGYALKKSDTSASVGLSILGSVSLPIRSNSDEMVKISSETIQSGTFYTRFFDLVSHYLSTVAKSEPIPASGAIQVTPLPPEILPTTATAATSETAPAGSAAPAAAVAAAATGAAALHSAALPATPVLGPKAAVAGATANAAANAAAAAGVVTNTAPVPGATAATTAAAQTLLAPVAPAAASAATAAASATASTATPASTAKVASGASAASGAATAAAAAASAASAPTAPTAASSPNNNGSSNHSSLDATTASQNGAIDAIAAFATAGNGAQGASGASGVAVSSAP